MIRILSVIFLLALWATLFTLPTACKKEPPLPDFNPYDTLSYPNQQIPAVVVDSASFLGLHNYVFSKSCNVPGCHDGSFEPDFRTVESSYNTLVRHGIVKNFPTGGLQYRVMPGNKEQSMLWKRITEHNPPNFERMPSSGNSLPENVLDNIGTWIDNGARDIFGVNPVQSSLQPSGFGVLAYLPNQGNQRIDDQRGANPYQPFMAPANDTIDLWFGYLEETVAGDTIFGNLLTVNQIKFSKDPFNFSNAVVLNMTPQIFTPLISTFAFSTINVGFPLQYTQKIAISPIQLGFQPGDIVYIRTYVKDSDHGVPTEIPQSDSPPALILYYSMVLQ